MVCRDRSVLLRAAGASTTRTFPTLATSRRSRTSAAQSTFWPEELPASPSPSPEDVAAWRMRVATWPSSFAGLLADCGLAGSSGKTSPVFCPRTAGGTSAPSSGRWRNSGMVAPGECWTLSSSECPSDAVASSLSDILETGGVPQRYFLSAKACAGILRRAAKRGKTLPDLLAAALASVAGATTLTGRERSCP